MVFFLKLLFFQNACKIRFLKTPHFFRTTLYACHAHDIPGENQTIALGNEDDPETIARGDSQEITTPIIGENSGQKQDEAARVVSNTPAAPFECDRCERVFQQRSSLQRHRRQSHPNAPPEFVCSCNEVFERMRELNRHKKECK
jgi:hypothetical protein